MQNAPKKKPKTEGNDSWSDDQKRREYYYDDACGYEVYEPEGDENEDIEPDTTDANRSK